MAPASVTRSSTIAAPAHASKLPCRFEGLRAPASLCLQVWRIARARAMRVRAHGILVLVVVALLGDATRPIHAYAHVARGNTQQGIDSLLIT